LRFRFVPDGPAGRRDDQLRQSDGGGVGPHFDSYDVFLLQAHGQRRWRHRPAEGPEPALKDLPLKILANFQPEFDELCAGAGRHAVPAAAICARWHRAWANA
jgi:50S ribosomal protein L16 3-hydroxylase